MLCIGTHTELVVEHMRYAQLGIGVLALLLAAFGCLSPPAARTLEFKAHNLYLSVEMAVTAAQVETGLMGRTHMGERSGMLFDMGHAYRPSFWMYRTLIPLDAVFLDENFTVVDIQSMTPCRSDDARTCPFYTSRGVARFVLEVNAGFCEKNNIKIGDKARLE